MYKNKEEINLLENDIFGNFFKNWDHEIHP
jgi:hypothetical protein